MSSDETPPQVPSKTCPVCKETKPITPGFYITKSGRTSGYCRACTKLRAVEWQKSNPDKMKVKNAKPRVLSPEQLARKRERDLAWMKANPERVRATEMKSRAKNADKILERARRKRAESPEVFAEASKRYNAKPETKAKHAAYERSRRSLFHVRFADARRVFVRAGGVLSDHDVTLEQWFDVCEEFGYCCAYCGVDIEHAGLDSTVDHITPVTAGGTHTLGNVIPACRSCNSSKEDTDFDAYCTSRGLDPAELRHKASCLPLDNT